MPFFNVEFMIRADALVEADDEDEARMIGLDLSNQTCIPGTLPFAVEYVELNQQGEVEAYER